MRKQSTGLIPIVDKDRDISDCFLGVKPPDPVLQCCKDVSPLINWQVAERSRMFWGHHHDVMITEGRFGL